MVEDGGKSSESESSSTHVESSGETLGAMFCCSETDFRTYKILVEKEAFGTQFDINGYKFQCQSKQVGSNLSLLENS